MNFRGQKLTLNITTTGKAVLTLTNGQNNFFGPAPLKLLFNTPQAARRALLGLPHIPMQPVQAGRRLTRQAGFLHTIM